MILNDLLSSDGFTPVNKKLAKELGFIVAGYFGELVRQRKRFGEEEFYFSQAQVIEEIGITEHEQRQAVKKLTEIGFIEVVKKGLPAKYYFKIADVTVLENLKHWSSKIGSTSARKNEAHNKNIINKKENNNIMSDNIKENLYKLYISYIPKEKIKWVRKQETFKWLTAIAKEGKTVAELEGSVKAYMKATEPTYRMRPQYFFCTSPRGKNYRVFEDYIGREEQQKATAVVDLGF